MALLPAPPINISMRAVGKINPPAATAFVTLTSIKGVEPVPITRLSTKEKLNDSV